MLKGRTLFMIGLFTYMAGIFISTVSAAAGAGIGVLGGLMMGGSTYFFILKK